MNLFFSILLLLLMEGVLHKETQEQKTVDVTVSVMEGQSVTLESNVTEIQRDMILWTYGDTRIAQMNSEPGKISLYDGDNEMFREKLQLNNQTGSLTIRNISTEHSGHYHLEIHSSQVLFKKFTVTVSAHLTVPLITKVSPHNSSSSERSSSSTCVLLCSVMNVTHVTLSWYKGNSLFSSISASDLNISLSLPLEVEYQDTNTYSCVLNNPIRNQTQHLHITDVCGLSHSAPDLHPGFIALICVVFGIIVAVVGVVCYKYCSRKAEQNDQPAEEELQNLNNGLILQDVVDEANNVGGDRSTKETDLQCSLNSEADDQPTGDMFDGSTDAVKTIYKKEGESVTLDTRVTIKEDDEIQWKFAKHKVFGETVQFVVIAERATTTDYEKLLSNSGRFRDRLQLDTHTGSLTITNLKAEDTGHYKPLISGRHSKTFNVIVKKRVLMVQRRHTTDNKMGIETTV